jgi:hypothetical protein
MLSNKSDVLLIGISHPNEVLFTFSRIVDGALDEEDAINYMKAEAFLDWDDAALDELLVVDTDLDVRQIDVHKYE